MKTVLILGRRHGSKKLELVTVSNDGKEVGKIKDDFKDTLGGESHKTYELLELWSSAGGKLKSRKFITESEAKRRSGVSVKASETKSGSM